MSATIALDTRLTTVARYPVACPVAQTILMRLKIVTWFVGHLSLLIDFTRGNIGHQENPILPIR